MLVNEEILHNISNSKLPHGNTSQLPFGKPIVIDVTTTKFYIVELSGKPSPKMDHQKSIIFLYISLMVT